VREDSLLVQFHEDSNITTKKMIISGDKISPLKVFFPPLLINSGDMPPLIS
jgi:hypothetical protein